MKFILSLQVTACLFLSVATGETCDMSSQEDGFITFDESADVKLSEEHRRSSVWGLPWQIQALDAVLRQILSPEEILFFRSALVLNIASCFDKNVSYPQQLQKDIEHGISMTEFYEEREYQDQGCLIDLSIPFPDILAESNLNRIEKEFGKEGRERLRKVVVENMLKVECSELANRWALYMAMPEESTGKMLFLAPLVYAMRKANDSVEAYLENPQLFHPNRIEKEEADIAAVLLRERVAVTMLIRTLSEPDLFTEEEKRIMFQSIKSAGKEELAYWIDRFLPTPFPKKWEKQFEKTNREGLVNRLADELNKIFPERVREGNIREWHEETVHKVRPIQFFL